MIDGGVAVYIDIEGAIARCLEIVQDPADIILDAISLQDPGTDAVEGSASPGLSLGFIDIFEAMEKYPTVQYRHLLVPDRQNLDSFDRGNFDGTYTQTMTNLGIADA